MYDGDTNFKCWPTLTLLCLQRWHARLGLPVFGIVTVWCGNGLKCPRISAIAQTTRRVGSSRGCSSRACRLDRFDNESSHDDELWESGVYYCATERVRDLGGKRPRIALLEWDPPFGINLVIFARFVVVPHLDNISRSVDPLRRSIIRIRGFFIPCYD